MSCYEKCLGVSSSSYCNLGESMFSCLKNNSDHQNMNNTCYCYCISYIRHWSGISCLKNMSLKQRYIRSIIITTILSFSSWTTYLKRVSGYTTLMRVHYTWRNLLLQDVTLILLCLPTCFMLKRTSLLQAAESNQLPVTFQFNVTYSIHFICTDTVSLAFFFLIKKTEKMLECFFSRGKVYSNP